MKYILAVVITSLIGLGIWKGIELSQLTKKQVHEKEVVAKLNKINYGLFNLQLWKVKAMDIFGTKIKKFKLDPNVYKDVDRELQKYLRRTYKEYISSGKFVNQFVDQALKDGRINKLFAKIIKNNVGSTLDGINIDNQLPTISQSIIKELKANEPMLVGYLKKGLENVLFDENDDTYTDPRELIYTQYNQQDLVSTTTYLNERIATRKILMAKTVRYVHALLFAAVLLSFVFFKTLTIKLSIPMVSISSIILLYLGITMPMIDIDARLNAFQMQLIGSTIAFDEQYLYYQSKSILDVTHTLLQGRGIDLKIVGIMILLFSIVIPFVKLILSMVYIYSEKAKNSTLIKNIVFYLGKWSMADVFVVAMFMAYIGFYGLITSQLEQISQNQNGFAVETLNYSQLSHGALFFSTYCILSIVIGIILQRIGKN